MNKKHYASRDREQQKFYMDHVLAMTVEGLHSKGDVAAELAHRDEKIESLEQQNELLRGAINLTPKDAVEHFGAHLVDNYESNFGGGEDQIVGICVDVMKQIEAKHSVLGEEG